MRGQLAATIALGSSLGLAAWWPMLHLIQQSTRLLHLDPAENDITLPYRRLLALFSPGIDGWPAPIGRAAENPFSGYSTPAYFWDTASYTGIIPIIAITALFILYCVRKRLPARRWLFLTLIGLIGVLGALPLMDSIRHLIPAMILRSPARLLYLTVFSLAVGMGAGVDALLGGLPTRIGRWKYAALGVVLVLHGLDLGGNACQFVKTELRADVLDCEDVLEAQGALIPNGRVAIDSTCGTSRSRFDDVGVYDSLLLARPYRALLAINGSSPRLNTQLVDGTMLEEPALRAGGVGLVVTPRIRTDLMPLGQRFGATIYQVQSPAPRSGFYGRESVLFLPEDEILERLRSEGYVKGRLMMPLQSAGAAVVTPVRAQKAHGTVVYHRPSSDEIVLDVLAGSPGFVNVLEAFDPGWSAQVDGQPAALYAGDGFTLALPVAAGQHTIRFVYSTPGRSVGVALSLLATGLLALLICFSPPEYAAAAIRRAKAAKTKVRCESHYGWDFWRWPGFQRQANKVRWPFPRAG
jgi:hypothetical protein